MALSPTSSKSCPRSPKNCKKPGANAPPPFYLPFRFAGLRCRCRRGRVTFLSALCSLVSLCALRPRSKMKRVASNPVVPVRSTNRGLLLLLIFTILPTALLAQAQQPTPPSHTLSGTVLDPSSAEVADAQITLLTSNGSVQASTTTDRVGYFFFDDLPHGKYRLRIHAAGFKDGLADVTVSAKPLAPLHITLAISAVSEVLSVTPDENVPQTSSNPSENLTPNNLTPDTLHRYPPFDPAYTTLL